MDHPYLLVDVSTETDEEEISAEIIYTLLVLALNFTGTLLKEKKSVKESENIKKMV